VLYAAEYGWDEHFEALVASVVAQFIQDYDPKRERCWIAEMNGEIVGSVFLVKQSDSVAKLRLLLVEPKARGLGIGNALVEACLGFAREVGYSAMTLWTHTVLESARRIYAAHGFQIVETHVHEEFGAPIQSETWRLDLA